jgi:hypothetical protein
MPDDMDDGHARLGDEAVVDALRGQAIAAAWGRQFKEETDGTQG